MRTFKCYFGQGRTCTLHVPDKAPENGGAHIQKITWSKKPTLSLTPKYVEWMHTVNQQLSNEWGINLAHIFQVKPGWTQDSIETWTYKPNRTPTRI